VQRLGELGWSERSTVRIEYRWADGRDQKLREFAEEFVRLNVDAIVTTAQPPTSAAKQATSTIPIIFAVATDPVGSGLVESLARPGGNVTGLSYQGVDVAPKRVELLREALSNLGRLAIIANGRGALQEMQQAELVARDLGIHVHAAEIRAADEIAPTIGGVGDKVDGLYVCASPLLNTHRESIARLALKARLPTMFGERENVEAGGLMSYGPRLTDLFRRAAEHVNKVLRGKSPAEIPVEQPTAFELVVSARTARELGLTIPPTLLARVDEVIE
jgi:putative tryptophan/tyrosine transport system substrate-binding protein